MNILVIGADGFIGRHVYDGLKNVHEVVAGINPSNVSDVYDSPARVDLMDKEAVADLLTRVKPEVVINCAGIVDPNAAPEDNTKLTKNVLEAVGECGDVPRRVVLMGSAASYGFLRSSDDIPVSEVTPLRAEYGYALSKRLEEEYVTEYAKEASFEIVVARLFNPIGKGMKSRFLIPSLIRQLDGAQSNEQVVLEISRLDSERDYIDVQDVALAIKGLAEAVSLRHLVYNVGSGRATSNEELISTVVDAVGCQRELVVVKETMPEPERLVASRADIGRITQDTGWTPTITLDETIKEIVDER